MLSLEWPFSHRAILTDLIVAAPPEAAAMPNDMKYRRYGLSAAVILAVVLLEVTGWVRDQRSITMVVITLSLLLGPPAGVALGKRFGDQFNRRK